MKKNIIFATVGIIAGLGFLGRTMLINNIRQSEKQAQESLIEAAEDVGALKSIDDANDINADVLQKIFDDSNKETVTDLEFEEYTPIDGIYSLGKIGGEYYLVEVATQAVSKLENVSNAKICYVKNEDNDSEFNGIFVFKEDIWYLIDENGNVLASLDNIDIPEKAKFIIRNNEIILSE